MEYILTELAWAAGFFDGEGWLGYAGRRPYLTLRIPQVDRYVLDRFQAAVGVGRVIGPFGPYQTNRQPQWRYNVNGPAVQQVIACLYSYLSPVKREQAAKALLAWQKRGQ